MTPWKEKATSLSRGKELILAFAGGLYVGVVAIVWSFALTRDPPNMSAYTFSTVVIVSVVVLVAWLGLFVFFVWTETNADSPRPIPDGWGRQSK